MKILFIKPDSKLSARGIAPPLGIMYIISSLKSSGFSEVDFFYLTLLKNPELEIKKYILKNKPSIVGVTVNSHDRFQAMDIIKTVKKIDPKITTIVGGPHATLCADSMINSLPELDILVVGDGESTMVEIAEIIRSGGDLSVVRGIYYRNKSGDVKITPPRLSENNLDIYPFPDWDIVNINDYDMLLPIDGEPKSVSLISSRGCPFRCRFCAAKEICGGIIRFRSIDNIIKEIKFLIDKFPGYHIFIYDDHFLLRKDRVLDFCNKIKKEGLNFKWACYGRVDSIDEEIAKNIAEIGCQMVSFGIESGSGYVLDLMNKQTDPRKISEAIKTIKSNGIFARCSIIFNYPGERIIDIFKTFLVLWRANIKPSEIFITNHVMIYPKTEIFYQLKYKYLPKDFSWEKDLGSFPSYKNIPIYIPPNNYFRVNLIKIIRKIYKIFYLIKS